MVSNVLDTYKKFHGKQIGILIRNGENLYVGWTDEEKVRIKDENVYLKPETRKIPWKKQKPSPGKRLLPVTLYSASCRGY